MKNNIYIVPDFLFKDIDSFCQHFVLFLGDNNTTKCKYRELWVKTC